MFFLFHFMTINPCKCWAFKNSLPRTFHNKRKGKFKNVLIFFNHRLPVKCKKLTKYLRLKFLPPNMTTLSTVSSDRHFTATLKTEITRICPVVFFCFQILLLYIYFFFALSGSCFFVCLLNSTE